MGNKKLLTNLFWDCACEKQYIQLHKVAKCEKCNTARLDAVLSLTDSLDDSHLALLDAKELNELLNDSKPHSIFTG